LSRETAAKKAIGEWDKKTTPIQFYQPSAVSQYSSYPANTVNTDFPEPTNRSFTFNAAKLLPHGIK